MSTDTTNWMSQIADSVLLCDINIPGTHDSASINASTKTAFATQNKTITEQLDLGVRALDVRLKVNGSPPMNFTFATCHGEIGDNEYQSFESLLDECKAFLASHPRETIVMSLKIDNWNGNKNTSSGVYGSLGRLLYGYPKFESLTNSKVDMPTLGAARGQLLLINRLNEEQRFGAPLEFADNTKSEDTASTYRNFDIHVQDHYDFLDNTNARDCINEKLADVIAAFGQKRDGMVVFNFGSAVYTQTLGGQRLFGVYIDTDLLNWFGNVAAAQRPTKLGWCFMDYATNLHSGTNYQLSFVDILVSSNFGYADYPNTFTVGEG